MAQGYVAAPDAASSTARLRLWAGAGGTRRLRYKAPLPGHPEVSRRDGRILRHDVLGALPLPAILQR